MYWEISKEREKNSSYRESNVFEQVIDITNKIKPDYWQEQKKKKNTTFKAYTYYSMYTIII